MTLTAAPDFESVCCVPTVELLIVTRFDEFVPLKENADVIVVVDDDANVTVVGCVVLLIVAKVLLPFIVKGPVPACLIVAYVMPPPLKVLADADVKLITEVLAVTVSPVVVVVSHTVPEPLSVHVDAVPKLIVLVFEFDELNKPDNVTAKPFVAYVPDVRVSEAATNAAD